MDERLGTLRAGLGELSRGETSAAGPEALATLRAVRNAFADPENAAWLRSEGVDEDLSAPSLLKSALEDGALARLLAQTWANAAASSSASAAAIWGRLFPVPLHALARAHAADLALLDPLCYLALTASRQVDGVGDDLLQTEEGRNLVHALLWAPSSLEEDVPPGAGSLLVNHLCLERDGLRALVSGPGFGVADPSDEGSSRIVAHLHAHVSTAPTSKGAPPTGDDAAECLLDLVRGLAGAEHEPSAGEAHVLQLLVQMTRDALGSDAPGIDDRLGCSGAARAPTTLDARLIEAGVAPLFLEMLRELPIPRQPTGVRKGGSASRYLTRQPYVGYKSDVLSVVANASFRRPLVQQLVLTSGGLEVVLSQCQADPHSPLAREWALWAVRNVCEDHPEAQEAIRSLRAQEAVQDDVLHQAGLATELDVELGKVKLVKADM